MPRASVREQLVNSALEVFHARGFNGSGVQDIVDAAGVPKGSFYNHFESKEALGVQVVHAYTALVGAYVVEAGAAEILSGPGIPYRGFARISRRSSSRTSAAAFAKGAFSATLRPNLPRTANRSPRR